MSIISQKTAGFMLITGLIFILAIGMITGQSLLFSLTLITGLILAILFLYQPKWGLIAFLIIRPSIDQLSNSLTLDFGENIEIKASALLGVLFIGLTVVFFLRNHRLIKKIPLKTFWLLLLTIVFTSIFFSIDYSMSFYEFIRMLSIFSVFSLTAAIVFQEKKLLFVVWAILASAITPFLFALYQLLTGTGMGRIGGLDSRLFGTFTHPNAFASFVLIIFSLLLFLFFNRKQIVKKQDHIWLYGSLLATLIILLGTYSRGAWLAMLIFTFTVSLFKSPKLILIILGVLFALFLTSQTVHDRIEEVYNPPADSSIRWRFKQWDKMIEAYKKEPLTGYGAGTETLVHEKEYGFYAGNPYTHNDFLKMALETGFFGFLAYFALIAATIINLFRIYRNATAPAHKDLALIILALFIAELGFAMTSNILRGTAAQWTLWALVGAVLVTSFSSLPLPEGETKRGWEQK